MYICEYTVQGNGDFPFDMLRYDEAVPVGPEDAAHMPRPDVRLADTNRVIRLRSWNRHAPTVDRWRSFGWSVYNIDVYRYSK